MTELTQQDISDILYDIRDVSIFFSKLEIEIPGLLQKQVVGSGLGGFHWSLFSRGADCNCCGNCCKRTFRRVWFWWDSEPRPKGLEPLTILLNGVEKVIHLHINEQGDSRCDFLVDTEQGAVCDLHTQEGILSSNQTITNIKPAHCHFHPLTGVYKIGNRLALSRRLPHRNFRWPQCPIDVASVRYSAKDFVDDATVLSLWETALDTVPGSNFDKMVTEYYRISLRALTGKPPLETVWF